MSDKPRILVITACLDVGGTERHLLQMMPRLRDSGYEIDIFVLQKNGALTADFEARRIRVYESASNYEGLVGLLGVSATLVRHLIRQHYDIIHYFLPAAYVVGACCSLVASRAIRIMSRRSLNRYQEKSPLIRTVERGLHPFMYRIVGNSTAVLNDLRAEGAKETSLALIYNGVAAFAPGEPAMRRAIRAVHGADDDCLVLICVANLFRYKGHRDVLEGLAQSLSALGDNWQVWFAGRDAGIGDELRGLAEKLAIADHVRWLGECDNVPALLQSADIGVQCSTEEGFSNAVLEAMAAGLPLIATRVGGNPDAVIDAESGLLVSVGSPREISGAVAMLAGSRSLRRQYGESGRRRVLEYFSVEAALGGYRDLYAAALAHARR
ncbi:MAG: glycosyltransferase [Pseudomonadales bacterium]